MKTKTRLISLLLAAMLFTLLLTSLPKLAANAEEDTSLKTIKSSSACANFVKDNFDEVIAQYNQSLQEQEDLCLATFVEGETLIYIIDKNEYGVYLDFNDNNGYMLIATDYEVYEFAVNGDLSYLKGIDFAYYSSFDKFLYYDEELESYEKYEINNIAEDYYTSADLLIETHLEQADADNGQEDGGGDGKIYDIDAYIKANYSNYTYVGRKIIPDYQWIYQWDTSVYQSDSGSEGNCVINSTYSMMNDWIRKGYVSGLPTGTVNYSNLVYSDSQYSTYGNGSFGTWRLNTSARLQVLPQLYMDLRKYAIDYGYLPDIGMQYSAVVNMVQNVASDNHISLSVKQTTSFTTPKQSIDDNHACSVCVNGSSYFGNHAMGLYGYVEYTYKSGWWIFSSTKTAYFYVVDDGHKYKENDLKYRYTDSSGITYPVCYYDPYVASPSISYTYLVY